ncbi:MAG: hypothetical protein ACOYL1_07015, partial [Chlamydiia bacterium]
MDNVVEIFSQALLRHIKTFNYTVVVGGIKQIGSGVRPMSIASYFALPGVSLKSLIPYGLPQEMAMEVFSALDDPYFYTRVHNVMLKKITEEMGKELEEQKKEKEKERLEKIKQKE